MICKTCGDDKEFNSDNFPSNKAKKHGLETICKTCNSKRANSYQKENRSATNAQRRARQKKNKENGICGLCREKVIEGSNLHCEKHYYSFTAYRHLGTKKMANFIREKLESQNFKCAYSGINLVLGINASVDHIKSRVRYPDLQNEPTNIHWVDIRINLMKRELDEEEFLFLIQSIHNNMIVPPVD